MHPGPESCNVFSDCLHLPLGCGGGTADTDAYILCNQIRINFFRGMNQVRIGIFLLHSANNTFPLELFSPAMKKMRS